MTGPPPKINKVRKPPATTKSTIIYFRSKHSASNLFLLSENENYPVNVHDNDNDHDRYQFVAIDSPKLPITMNEPISQIPFPLFCSNHSTFTFTPHQYCYDDHYYYCHY